MRRPFRPSAVLPVILAFAVAACGSGKATPAVGDGSAGAGASGAAAGGSASPSSGGGMAGASSGGNAGSPGSGAGSTGAASGGPAVGTASPGTGAGSGGPGASSGPVGNLGPIPSAADALQSRIVAVVREVNPSVVLIQTDQGLGSGVVFDAQGDIVTNAHVAAGATSYTVNLSDGRHFPATLVGAFAADDLAVIRIQAAGLHPASFGDSSALEVGDIVIAVGNPLGLQSSVTEGIVSALGRVVSEPGGGALPNVIQTSAAINPGNSGGALVDLNGQVVGIPTLAASDPQLGGAAAGIGFAIPSSTASDIARQLIQYGKVVDSHRAYLGLRLADTISGGGVVVASVQSGGPAAKAGLQPGDVIVAVNGTPTPTTGDLSDLLASLKPGQTVHVDVVRGDGSKATVDVVAGEYPG